MNLCFSRRVSVVNWIVTHISIEIALPGPKANGILREEPPNKGIVVTGTVVV